MNRLFFTAVFLLLLSVGNYAHAEERVLVIQPGLEDGKDTYYGINSVGGREGRPDNYSLRVGGWGDIWNTFIQFDLSQIPEDAVIQSAQLELFSWRTDTRTNYGKIYRVTESWNEADPSDTWSPAVFDYGMSYQEVPSMDWWVVNTTELTTGWVSGEYENYGIKILGQYNSNNHVKEFYSSDYLDDPTLRPKLVITYSVPDPEPEPEPEPEEDTVSDLVAKFKAILNEQISNPFIKFTYSASVDISMRFYESGRTELAVKTVEKLIKRIVRDEARGVLDEATVEALQETAQDLIEKIEEGAEPKEKTPLVTQVSSPYSEGSEVWANEEYANGVASESCGTLIGECGCALSSVAMIAKTYGVETGIDGSKINPSNMNDWLENNDGYTRDGGLMWGAALKYLGKDTPAGTKTNFTLESFKETNLSQWDSFLNSSGPAIAFNKPEGHYFVFTEKNSDGSYDVRDPFWFETKTTNDIASVGGDVRDYNNVISHANLISYKKNPQKMAGMIEIHLGSPAELLLTNSEGQRVGYDAETGLILNEIEGSSYDQESVISTNGTNAPHTEKVLMVLNPEDEMYTIDVIGTGEGEYTLTVLTIEEGGESEMETVVGTTTEGKVDTVVVEMEVEKDKSYKEIWKEIKGEIKSLSLHDRLLVIKNLISIKYYLHKEKYEKVEKLIEGLIEELEGEESTGLIALLSDLSDKITQ